MLGVGRELLGRFGPTVEDANVAVAEPIEQCSAFYREGALGRAPSGVQPPDLTG